MADCTNALSENFTYGLYCAEGRNCLKILDVVPGSVAHLMGIRKGWLIVSINNGAPKVTRLRNAISQCISKQDICIHLSLKDNKGRIKQVGLPISELFRARFSCESQEEVWRLAGFMIGFCVDTDYYSLYVAKVRLGSRAEKSGLRVLDRIVAINDVLPYTPEQFFQELFSAETISIRVQNAFGDVHLIRVGKTMLLPCARQLLIEKAALEGEERVSDILAKLGDDYQELRNIILPLSYNQGTEIDHILIGPKGVFVIETKRLAGHITGSDKDKYWVQSVGQIKKQIFNPVWQNRYHVNAVKKLFKAYGIIVPVMSVVMVVVGQVDVDSETPVFDEDKKLVEFIQKQPETLSAFECGRIVQVLKCEKQSSFYSW